MHKSFVPGKPGLQIIPAGSGRFYVVDGDGAKATAARLTKADAEALIAKEAAPPVLVSIAALPVSRPLVANWPADKPLLSICIPTRNRAAMLRTCLAELFPVLRMLPFAVEVVISDNCSTDDTGFVANSPIGILPRYILQREPLSVVDNYFAAMRHARGKYCHYLADDDALKPEGLIAAVEWMERNPAMAACFNPQENVAYGTDALLGMENDLVHKPAILARGDYLSLTDLIGKVPFHPEVPLVRSEVWRRHVTAPRKMFFGFWVIGCLLEAGDIGIGTHAYYLHRQRPPTAKNPQIQYEFATDRMDEHRLGLEMLYLRAVRQSGKPLGAEQRLKLAGWIEGRMAGYAETAARVSAQNGDHQAAAEFLSRAALWNGLPIEDLEAEMLGRRITEEIARRAASTDGALQLVDTAAQRDGLIATGTPAELVVAREDIAQALAICPPRDRIAVAA